MIISEKLTSREPGFSLIELMVSAGVGAIILTAVILSFICCTRSFAAIGNYIDLNRVSQNALDQMSRDIRQASSLQSFATNQLVFLDSNSNQLTFAWSPLTSQLTRSSGGATDVLLKNCDYLSFDISQRNPVTDGAFGFYTASNNPAVCKLVSVSWRCSRTIFGEKMNTESVQTAKIVLRN
ncbi:MAG: prepilin-type N-terminal cleavage/methylation domain-containing protein [Verrucomicrobiota bacterium]